MVGPDDFGRGQVEAAVFATGQTVVAVESAPALVVAHDPAATNLEDALGRLAALRGCGPVLAVTERPDCESFGRLLGAADDVLPWPIPGELLGARLMRLEPQQTAARLAAT